MNEVALLTDTITIECFRPKGRFGEVKYYWDDHHKVYGLKEEVSVTSARPHVAVSCSPHYPGSAGDYRIHREKYELTTDYLTKTPEEKAWPGDKDPSPYWGNLGDKQYIGPATDTPHERRITPIKGASLSSAQKTANKKKSTTRVPVEQYFGRLVRKCAIMGGVYRFDHRNFDTDFENCCMLVNEDITISALSLDDGEFYQKFLDARLEKWRVAEANRKKERETYAANKKAKLLKVQKFVGE